MKLRHLFTFFSIIALLVASAFIGATVGKDAGIVAGIAVALFALNVGLGPIVTTWRGQCLGDNVIAGDLQLDVILDAALTEFKNLIFPITFLSTVFRDVKLQGTDKVGVPYYPLESAASRDYDGTYVFDGSETEILDVTINKRKYQSMAFTSADLARQPQLKPEKIGAMKGRKLAEDVLTDILSLVTNANFGAAVSTGAASAFDVNDVADIRTALDTAKWPKMGRGLILSPDYDGALFKANPLLYAMYSGDGGAQLRSGQVQPFAGFENYAASTIIPANGENLVGFAVYPSAILTAFSPIEPAPNTRKTMADYRVVTDPETGLTLEYRAWGDPDNDTDKAVIEVNYGRAVGEANALKRIVSA